MPRALKLSLVPRTSEFYDLFSRAGANALEAARLIERRFREYPNASVSQADVKAVEHEGDTITRELIQLLNTQYITPFDREDIYALATRVDDVVDHMDEASELLDLYGVESPDPPGDRAVPHPRRRVRAPRRSRSSELKGLHGVERELVALKELEDEGDRVVRDAIADLFRDPRIDPLIVIRWKDIFEALEDALDACETAANVVGNIVVKNA